MTFCNLKLATVTLMEIPANRNQQSYPQSPIVTATPQSKTEMVMIVKLLVRKVR